MKLTVDIGVGGRFHADYMAQAFWSAGHDIRLYTSYPKSRFPDLPASTIQTVLLPEIVYRAFGKLGAPRLGEHFKMRAFGTRLAEKIAASRRKPDIFISWSSFGLETFRTKLALLNVCVRDSTHIEYQSDILAQEHKKFGIPFARDHQCINRELEEYQLADEILVLSDFAKQTFKDRGIAASKIKVLNLGVNTTLFHPRKNFLPHRPLHVIYFGTLSLRKGIFYLLEATRDFAPSELKLFLVGPIEESFKPILKRFAHAEVLPALRHPELSQLVREMDVYVFPSLEDGYPNTLVQAMASGLVPVTTNQCGPARFIVPGTSGFFIPPGDAPAIRSRLQYLIKHPHQLCALQGAAAAAVTNRSWQTYASDLSDWTKEIYGRGDRGEKTIVES